MLKKSLRELKVRFKAAGSEVHSRSTDLSSSAASDTYYLIYNTAVA